MMTISARRTRSPFAGARVFIRRDDTGAGRLRTTARPFMRLQFMAEQRARVGRAAKNSRSLPVFKGALRVRATALEDALYVTRRGEGKTSPCGIAARRLFLLSPVCHLFR